MPGWSVYMIHDMASASTRPASQQHAHLCNWQDCCQLWNALSNILFVQGLNSCATKNPSSRQSVLCIHLTNISHLWVRRGRQRTERSPGPAPCSLPSFVRSATMMSNVWRMLSMPVFYRGDHVDSMSVACQLMKHLLNLLLYASWDWACVHVCVRPRA